VIGLNLADSYCMVRVHFILSFFDSLLLYTDSDFLLIDCSVILLALSHRVHVHIEVLLAASFLHLDLAAALQLL